MTAHADLFRHVSAEKAAQYRAIMQAFAAAKRQFRLHLRPDEVRTEAAWPAAVPPVEEVQQALSQLVDWGNLEAQPDTARVQTIEDFYRARFLYRLSHGGEAVETALDAFTQALMRRGELQSVALEDIIARLNGLQALATDQPMDAAKVHEALRDLVTVFSGLADNAQAFMAGLARSIELQRAEAQAVMAYKTRLIDYLERFIGDLVSRSGRIAESLQTLEPRADHLLQAAATREARDAAPGELGDRSVILEGRLDAWRERWRGLTRWFLSTDLAPSQAELLRSRARSAIPQLLSAVTALNERRAGRSDRANDFRVLAQWFAECPSDPQAHRLWRAAFALNPARHLSLSAPDEDCPANTPWAEAPSITIHPKLRERGTLTPRSTPRVQDRSRERARFAQRLAEEAEQMAAAYARFAHGRPMCLSELGSLDRHEFKVFLQILGEALAGQRNPDLPVERTTGDGLWQLRLEPLPSGSWVEIDTELGRFAGRDHRLTLVSVDDG
jgi:uncharacterized protein (TIGR02677 family)